MNCQKPDGTREIIHFDVLKLEKGQIADPLIQANDIVFVPSSYLRGGYLFDSGNHNM